MRILLTGARAPATLELARLGARAGYEMHVADTSAWHVCRGSKLIAGWHTLPPPRGNHGPYADAVRALVRRFRIDVIVPTCEEVFHLAAVRDDVGARVASEPLAVLAPLHDKWRFIAACATAGVAFPPTHLLSTPADLADLPESRYILKRRYSRFATQVFDWRTGDPLPIRQMGSETGWLAQTMLSGPSLCSWSTATRGRLLAHATYAVDATAGSRGAAIAFHSIRHDGVLAWVRQFVASHRLSGQFAFDFIDTAAGVIGIECNPRLTSGVHCFRSMPAVAATLFESHVSREDAPLLEPPSGVAFRSRLAMALYRKSTHSGAGLLDATDDPWPRRLQLLTWSHLLLRAALNRQDPRAVSTRDIEWNGE